MSLFTEYRGYTINYDQNQDAWNCYDCGVSGETTLSKVKEKIDRMHLKMRKDSAVPCYEIAMNGRDHQVQAVEATIIDYLGRKESRSWLSREITFEGHKVASVAQRHGSEKRSRKETMLHNLAPISPEVHAQIEEANRLGEIASQAEKAFQAAVKAIPRVQFEDISGLVEASDHKFKEGEA